MNGALWFLLTVAVLGVVATYLFEGAYVTRSQRVQVVQIDRSADSRLGPVTRDVGDPTRLVIDDPKAFLKNKTPFGDPMVDADYLKSHGGTVIRLESIQSTAGLARIGCCLSGFLAIAGLVLLKRLPRILMPPNEDS